MKKTSLMCLLLALAMMFSLLAGCAGDTKPAASEEPAAVEESNPAEVPEADAEQPADESEAVEEAEPVVHTGAVLSKEECAAMGYDVKHGMYDFETYVELPISDGSNEPLSFWLMVQPYMTSYGVDMTDVTYFREMEARTGVNIDVQACSFFIVSEQFNLIIASGDIPDMMESVGSYYNGGLEVALEEEVFQDVAPLIDEYMPNLKGWLDTFPTYRADLTTLNGTITTAPGFGTGMPWNVGIQLRQDWLDELGMDIPVTYDEYYEVMKAFKTNYGATLWVDGAATTRENCYSAGYGVILPSSSSTAMLSLDGETPLYSPVSDEFREYLTTFRQWWNEGLVYDDFLAQANISTPDTGLVSNNEIGIWVSDADTMASYEELAGVDVGAAPQMRKTADQTIHLYMGDAGVGEGTSIAYDCKDVELACKWLDYNYTYDGGLLNCYGVEGEGMVFDENGNPGLSDLILNNPDMIVVASITVYAKYNGAGIFDVDRFTKGYTDEQYAACDTWTTNVDNAYGDFRGKMTTDQSERYSALMLDIATYTEQSTLRFILGEMSLENDWDSYVETVYSLGLQEVYDIQLEAHDTYISLMG